eukprot:1738283-Alexandrium_andersonii.AAC.1
MLRGAISEGAAGGFHAHRYPKGHAATHFERWLRGAGPVDLRKGVHGVNADSTEYECYFEPYVVVAREGLPLYDERFR